MSQPAIYILAYALLLVGGLIILRVVVRRAYRERGRLTPVACTLQAVLFFIYGGFPVLYLHADWPAVQVNPVQQALGLFLLYGGLVMMFYGMIILGVLRSLGLGQTGLNQYGLYRFTRNPQALACGAYVVGFALLWPSWYALGWAILYAILIHAMVVTEEEHLRRLHGHSYDYYRRKAPRYLGKRQKHE